MQVGRDKLLEFIGNDSRQSGLPVSVRSGGELFQMDNQVSEQRRYNDDTATGRYRDFRLVSVRSTNIERDEIRIADGPDPVLYPGRNPYRHARWHRPLPLLGPDLEQTALGMDELGPVMLMFAGIMSPREKSPESCDLWRPIG